MGQGDKREELELTARSTPWSDRIHALDPVPPSDLLRWVSSADVGVIPNRGDVERSTVIAEEAVRVPRFWYARGGSDFPTMRSIIVADPSASLGAVCDPASAGAIAEAIRSIVSRAEGRAGASRSLPSSRCRTVELAAQIRQLLALYRDVAPAETSGGRLETLSKGRPVSMVGYPHSRWAII